MGKLVYKNTRQSGANYLKQNAIDYQSHFTIENNLEAENGCYFENKRSSPLREKRLGYVNLGE